MTRYLLAGPIAMLALFSLLSCDYSRPSAEELSDPTKALHIQINSIPSGASVYGVDGDKIGPLLGVTPMTFQYIYRHTASGPIIYGTNVDQTIVRHIDVSDLLYPPYSFHCWLVKEGYRDHSVVKALKLPEWMTERNFHTAFAFSPRIENITVELIPVESEANGSP